MEALHPVALPENGIETVTLYLSLITYAALSHKCRFGKRVVRQENKELKK